MVATPCIDGMLHGNHVDGLLSAHDLIVRTGCTYARMDGESDIHRARSRLATICLEETACAALLFIDADIGFTRRDLAQILDDLRHVPIVGGVYAKKQEGALSHVYTGCRGETAPKVSADLLEVDAIGTGFLGITRAALEEVKKVSPRIHGEKKDWSLIFRGRAEIRRETPGAANLDYLTEDYAFCHTARKMGFPIYLERRVRLTHRGHKIYTA